MVRIRQGLLVAVVGLAFALVAACKKDEKKSDVAGDMGGKTGEPMAEKPPAASDDLSLLPVDAEMVLGVNFSQVQQSSLWKKFVEPRLTGDVQRQFGEFKTKCGFDPMTSVKSMSAGIKPSTGDGTVVLHGVDKAKSWECIDKMKDEFAKNQVEFTREGDVGIMKAKNGTVQNAFMFINDSTVLAVFGQNGNAAGVKAAAAGGSTLKTSQAFVEMHSKIKTTDSAWFVVNAKVLDGVPMLGAIGVKPRAVFGSVNVTDGLAFDVRMTVESPEAAAQFATMARSQAQQASKMVDKAEVTNDGSEVRISVVMSSQKLEATLAQLSGLMSAFGGMGGQ